MSLSANAIRSMKTEIGKKRERAMKLRAQAALLDADAESVEKFVIENGGEEALKEGDE